MPGPLPSSFEKLTRLGIIAAGMFLGCAQSEVLDFPDNDSGTTRATGLGGLGPDAGDLSPGSGGSASTTGSGGVAASGQGGAGTGGSTGHSSGGTNGGSNGSGFAGNAGAGAGGIAAPGGQGGSAIGGRSGAGGAGHGSGGTAGTIGGSGGAGASGGSAPTFTTIYTEILAVYCTGSSCHNPGTSGGLSFATEASAFAALSSLVIPGNGAGSDFYATVDSGAMPKGRAKLSATNLALIKMWIDAGALDD